MMILFICSEEKFEKRNSRSEGEPRGGGNLFALFDTEPYKENQIEVEPVYGAPVLNHD